MPRGVDEVVWRRAERQVEREMKRGYRPRNPYAVVRLLYNEMMEKHMKKPKKPCKNPHTCSCTACKKKHPKKPKKPRATR